MNEKLTTKEITSYDIVVVGGGVAGICAAVAAKRCGIKKVLLLEKSVITGGLATSGLISWYEPICDGQGKKIAYGMADELFQTAIRYSADTLDDGWRKNPDVSESAKRFSTHFSPAVFTMALDELLMKNDVDILLDTQAVRPVMQGSMCSGIVVENKTGRGFYHAKMIIDTSGDADILFRAGATCAYGDNYLTYIAYYSDMKTLKKAIDTQNIIEMRRWKNAGSDLWGKGHPEKLPLYTGVTAEEITEFVLAGRKKLFESIKSEDKNLRDITVLPSMAQFRKTRRICGEYTLTEDDEGKRFEDSIGVIGDFANRGKVYELPFRTQYSKSHPNILTAGRTISSSGWAWDVTRVIPAAAETGQAAGTAAALCIKNGINISELDINDLQYELVQAGAHLHI